MNDYDFWTLNMGLKHKSYAKVLMKLELVKQSETNVSIVKMASCKNCFNGVENINFI